MQRKKNDSIPFKIKIGLLLKQLTIEGVSDDFIINVFESIRRQRRKYS